MWRLRRRRPLEHLPVDAIRHDEKSLREQRGPIAERGDDGRLASLRRGRNVKPDGDEVIVQLDLAGLDRGRRDRHEQSDCRLLGRVAGGEAQREDQRNSQTHGDAEIT